MSSVNEKMTAIADEIRDKTGGTEPLTLDGIKQGVGEVFEAGKDAEYRAFWDSVFPPNYDENIGIGYAPYRFAGHSWNDRNFRPTRNLKFKSSILGLFRISGIKNLKKCLEDCGVTLDTSKATDVGYAFSYGNLEYIPKVSIVNAKTSTGYIFGGD